jgi:hypothetical protein
VYLPDSQGGGQMIGTPLYVAILEDRHIDTVIEVFAFRLTAFEQVNRWQANYGDRYKWHNEEIDGWMHYRKTDCDDGPSIRIEMKELK